MMGDDRLLVVEGSDDKHVVSAIHRRRGLTPNFKIDVAEGYEKLRDGLALRVTPGTSVERLGIVVDADQDIAARWQSLRDVLSKAGYADVPIVPDAQGTVVEDEILPKVGVWIMPDNQLPGMLEDYLAFLVPSGDVLLDHARASLDAIPAEARRFSDVHRSKALNHTWLAWQEDPGSPMGQAITKRYLDAEGPRVVAFLDWLTRVFA